ncbi:MAG TPA: hypothetical protein DCW90_18740 [Lachnospiraceae bacterium]|nr:hypothetical protein [Lachnospiraceae bacterium]
MPKIVLNRTIQYKRKTYRLGETVEISVEDVEMLKEFGEIIVEEQQKKTEIEQPRKSTKRNTKRADK